MRAASSRVFSFNYRLNIVDYTQTARPGNRDGFILILSQNKLNRRPSRDHDNTLGGHTVTEQST